MHRQPKSQTIFAEDRLAGLIFATQRRWCFFRPDNDLFIFNHPLDVERQQALVDPETDQMVGVHSRDGFSCVKNFPPLYRVFLLRPLIVDIER